ncbi:uncharacterized protein LOC124644607 [Helicoverpa zea]|uniref:uncharacterized protein LOC124644607 n=1 Tax=Helicoverpa zea TaxID=7113 RepID=UPI001F590832|nr:uncharacterized protein LOC124644607 [Helicoverpa zea]
MSVPALRQPKKVHIEEKRAPISYAEPQNYLIVTLNDGQKLVVSSDAYHGMLTAGELFRCVFCETEMVRDVICKERHKSSENHRKILESYPHVEEFKENLIRKLSGGGHYCTVCNVIVTSHFIHKHISSDVHHRELQMALGRATSYKPFN